MSHLLGVVLANALISGLLALLAWTLSQRIRRQTLVHGLWVLALVKLVTPPVVPLPLLPDWELPSLTLPEGPATVVVEAGAVTRLTAAPASAGRPSESSPARMGEASPTPEPRPTSPAAALPAPTRPVLKSETRPGAADPQSLAWTGLLLGALVVATLAGVRILRFRRLLRLATPAPPSLQERAQELATRVGLRRAPPVRVLPGAVPPMLWPTASGPLLLLPSTLLPELTDEERDTLLVHELAHVRRRDHWVRLLELAATTLFWWYPVTWWVRRALRRAEERCCDEWVLRVMPESAPAYARALLKSLDLLVGEPDPLPVGASGAGPVRDLESRLKEIVMTTRPTPQLATPARFALAVAALLGLAVFPTQAQSPAPPEEPALAAPRELPAPPAPVVPVAPVSPAPIAAPVPTPRPVVAPAPAPRPVVSSVTAPAPPRPVVAPGESPEDEAELRELEERQLRLEAQRSALHRQQLLLASERMEREEAARERTVQATVERLRASGETGRAAKVEAHAHAMAGRMEIQRRDLALELARTEESEEMETALRAKLDELRAAERAGTEQETAALRAELRRLERQHVRGNLAHEERQIALQREAMEVEHRARAAEVGMQMEMAVEAEADMKAEMEHQQQRMRVERALHEQELQIHEAERAVREKELEVHEHEAAGRVEEAESARSEAEHMRQEMEGTRRGLHEERLLQATSDLALQMESQLQGLINIQSEGAANGPEVQKEIERLRAALAALRR